MQTPTPGLLLACLWLAFSPSRGQSIPPDFFHAALPGAGIARTTPASVWANPAGLPALRTPAYSLLAAHLHGQSDLRYLGAALARPLRHAAIGLQLTHLGAHGYQEQRIALQYGRRLFDGFCLGAEIIALHTSIRQYGSRWLPTFAIGGQVRLNEQLRLGMRWHNPSHTYREAGPALPTSLAVGWAYQPSRGVVLSGEIDKSIRAPLCVRIRVGIEPHRDLALAAGIRTAPASWTTAAAYRLFGHWRCQLGVRSQPPLGLSVVAGLLYHGQ